jgi:beta-N-acetylhexosaminidase
MNYGPIWIDLDGTEVLPQEIPLLQHKNTGGVVLFPKNYTDVAQLRDLTSSIRKYADKPILIAVDHEGGRVWGFADGFIKPAAPQFFGNLYKKNPDVALARLELAGQIVAHELLNCGVDLTFAPVLDIDTGVSTIIGDRSYGDDPFIVTNCARAFIRGLNQQGMGSVGKHFPGHGGCEMDSHFTTTIDTRSFAQMEQFDLVPFAKLHNELTGVMPAHVIYSSIDPLPAGVSKFWLQTILRKKIGFNGAIISDCLSMVGSGFADNIAQGTHHALDAGCDMVIIAKQTRNYLLQLLDTINWDMHDEQIVRVVSLAGDFDNPRLKTKLIIQQELIAD